MRTGSVDERSGDVDLAQPVPVEPDGLEAEDGVVEVERVMPHLDFAWAVLDPGPRRWAPTDLSVEATVGGTAGLDVVRMTYRTVGDRVVVVGGARSGVDVEDLAERLARPLLFAHLRKVHPDAPVTAVMGALDAVPHWDGGASPEGWRTGLAGSGERPVRLAHREQDDGHVVVAIHGCAAEEASTIVGNLLAVTDERAEELHVRHRRALAQRWWDAPRTPWTPAN